MPVSFESVTLDTESPDRDARLVYRDGRLLAILSCLSELHGELAGGWFVEAMFNEFPVLRPPVFQTLEEAESWLAAGGSG